MKGRFTATHPSGVVLNEINDMHGST